MTHHALILSLSVHIRLGPSQHPKFRRLELQSSISPASTSRRELPGLPARSCLVALLYTEHGHSLSKRQDALALHSIYKAPSMARQLGKQASMVDTFRNIPCKAVKDMNVKMPDMGAFGWERQILGALWSLLSAAGCIQQYDGLAALQLSLPGVTGIPRWNCGKHIGCRCA